MNKKIIIADQYLDIASILARASKFLLGPFIIIAISARFSSEQIVLYYLMFSLLGITHYLDFGVGFAVKQRLSTMLDSHYDREKLGAYVLLMFIWYSIIAIFILFIIFPVGKVLISQNFEKTSNIFSIWKVSVLLTFFVTFLPILGILIEAKQKLLQYQIVQFIATLGAGLALLLSIVLDYGLYALCISVGMTLALTLTGYVFILAKLWKELTFLLPPLTELLATFADMKKFIGRSSVVWISGYIFWNIITLVSYLKLNISVSAQLIFTLAILRSIFLVTQNIVSARVPEFAWMAANETTEIAYRHYSKRLKLSCVLFIICVSILFLIVVTPITELDFFRHRLIDVVNLILLALCILATLLSASNGILLRSLGAERMHIIWPLQAFLHLIIATLFMPVSLDLYSFSLMILTCGTYLVSRNYIYKEMNK